jgi:hypothetical protein
MSTSGPLQHDQIPHDGFTPSVQPRDLENVWKLTQDMPLVPPSQVNFMCIEDYARVCSPGADVTAVWYRAGFFRLLAEHLGLLNPEAPSQMRKAFFELAAKFPLKRMELGVRYDEWPMDADGFVKQLRHALGSR